MSEIIETIPPFKLSPSFKDYIWGGNRLKTQFNKQTQLSIVAESWELSTHPDGQSTIATGALSEQSLGDAIARHPELCEVNGTPLRELPILIKLIDARDNLSIQVHPDDEYAWRVEGQPGKTEAWFILDCDEDSFVYYGFNKTVSREEVRQRIEQNTLTEILHNQPVKPGDVIFIPAGTVHAIGKGILLAEVQQSSNVTYRVYDYGRRDSGGALRELHIDKALDVMQLAPTAEYFDCKLIAKTNEYSFEQLVQSSYFNVQRLDLKGKFSYPFEDKKFAVLLCIDGEMLMGNGAETLVIKKGDCVYLPSCQKGFSLEGFGQTLITTI